MKTRRTLVPLATSAVLALTLAACGESGNDEPGGAATSSDDGSSPAPSDDAEGPGGDGTDEPTQGGDGGSTGDAATAVYFVADGPLGPRLVREFQAGGADLASAVDLLSGSPVDPDYSNLVAGWVQSAALDGDEIVATVDGGAPGEEVDTDASLAVQQVVYTLQAAAGDPHPVRFVDSAGSDVTALAGATNPVAAAPQIDTLLLVNVTDPAEGTAVSGSFTATGRASSFENTVRWELRSDADGVVADGFTTAEGDWTTGLVPWEATVDVSGLAAGTYTFVASTDDPSGGEGPGPAEDSKTITVQ
ncbi:MAG TPA: Gmad2 immunoglobulin-like domain-containing protein [Nocardioides sp.]